MSGTGQGGPADPGDPFRNPGWGGPDAYPEAPPSAPPPWASAHPPLPPPSQPSAPKTGTWPIVVAVLAGFAVMLGVLGFLASSGDDDDGSEAAAAGRDDEDDDDATTSSSTSASTSTSTTTSTTTTTAAPPDLSDLPAIGGPVVSSGDWSIQLPDGWAGADVAPGVDGVGDRIFPDDPALAAQVEASLQSLPRAVRLFGIDRATARGGAAFVSNLNILTDPTAASGMPMEQLLEVQRRGLDALGIATIQSADVVELGGRPVGRLALQLDGVPARTLAYVIDTGREVVVITYTVARGSSTDAVFDASVATFSAG